MLSPLLQWLPHVVWMSLLSLGVGAASYSVCRVFERLWPTFIPLVPLLLLAGLVFWVFCESWPLSGLFTPVVFPVVPAIVGGWLHRLSDGESWTAWQAFSISYLSIVLHIVLFISMLSLCPDVVSLFPSPTSNTGGALGFPLLWELVFWLGLITLPPIISPLALWVRQYLSSRRDIRA